LKSGKDADGRRVNRPTENVSISNCTVHHAHGAVTLGSEISGSIRNVVADNITCDGTQIGIRIKSRRGRGGCVENVRFDNWTMENVGLGINVTSHYIMEGETKAFYEPVSVRTPLFRNIAISHVTINHARRAIEIEGLPEMPISELKISDVVASVEQGATASCTSRLELHDVQVDTTTGPAFRLRDSTDLELYDISSRRALKNAPVIRLEHCPGAILRYCRAFAGTGTFLSIAPGELKEVSLVDNLLSCAQKPVMEEASNSR
jgi:hypothetical protein